MARENVGEAALMQMLIAETASRSGRAVQSLARQIRLTRQTGEPNWKAECGVVGIVESRAFRDAVKYLQQIYDVD